MHEFYSYSGQLWWKMYVFAFLFDKICIICILIQSRTQDVDILVNLKLLLCYKVFLHIGTKKERRLTIERSSKNLISQFLTSSLFFFWYKEFWIITLIIILIVYILGKSFTTSLKISLLTEGRIFSSLYNGLTVQISQ